MKKIVLSILFVLFMFSMVSCGNVLSSNTFEESSLRFDASSVTDLSKSNNSSVCAQYEIGDIILADGSVIKDVDLVRIDNRNVPISVIAGFWEDGTVFGIGVHRSNTPLQWATGDSTGYATNFEDIICMQKSDFVFLGDKDGRDNWEAICVQDSKDTANAAMNYPAFHFANSYAANYGLTGDYATGWYMPSIAELCVIYQNREVINNSLQHIYRLDNQAAMNGLETNWYWSASQAASQDDYAWFVHYFNGYAGECPKNFTNVHTLVIHVVSQNI